MRLRLPSVLLALAAAGCARGARVRVAAGSTARDLVFEVRSGLGGADSLPPPRAIEVRPGAIDARRPGALAWELVLTDTARARGLRRFRYGEPLPGYTAAAGTPALLFPGSYRLEVRGRGYVAVATFHIETDGGVTPARE